VTFLAVSIAFGAAFLIPVILPSLIVLSKAKRSTLSGVAFIMSVVLAVGLVVALALLDGIFFRLILFVIVWIPVPVGMLSSLAERPED
jgi:hypothetical protein